MIPLVKTFIPPKEKLMPRLEKILYSGYISEGDSVYKFERKFSDLIGNPFCISTNSGTAAIHIALKIVGVTKGDEVISTALTAEPTNTTIALTGAKVIFADVDPENGLISPISIERLINKKTKAIMVVHYAGMVCDLESINKISEKYKIPVIEDAAHALLSSFKGQYIGNNSRFTCFSFQAIKQLTTVDGGMLCLKNEIDYSRAKKLRWFGLEKNKPRLQNNIVEAGFKYHMNNVNATIGDIQLEYLHKNINTAIENGRFFDRNIIENIFVKKVRYQDQTIPSYWLYTLLVKKRDKFIEYMTTKAITSSELHLRNDFHKVFKSKLKLPMLDLFYSELVHIPVGWWVTKKEREYIVKAINDWSSNDSTL